MKNKALRLTGKSLSVASIAFLVCAIWKKGFDFSFVENAFAFILVFLAGVAVKTGSLWVSGTAWATWLKFFSRTPFRLRDARQVFIRANIGRYIPGNVMHFVQRNIFASDMGIGQLQLAASTVFEVASYVSVALLTAALTAREGLRTVLENYFGDIAAKFPAPGLVLASAAVAIPIVLFAFRKRIRNALEGYRAKDFAKSLLAAMALQLATLAMLGAIMVLLVHYAKGSLSLSTARLVVSTYIVAWVLGFVVPGASGGIGIREMALYLLLGPVIGKELVLSLAMIHRLITIIGDFLGYLIVVLRERKEKGENEHA